MDIPPTFGRSEVQELLKGLMEWLKSEVSADKLGISRNGRSTILRVTGNPYLDVWKELSRTGQPVRSVIIGGHIVMQDDPANPDSLLLFRFERIVSTAEVVGDKIHTNQTTDVVMLTCSWPSGRLVRTVDHSMDSYVLEYSFTVWQDLDWSERTLTTHDCVNTMRELEDHIAACKKIFQEV